MATEKPLTIWCDVPYREHLRDRLRQGLGEHELVLSPNSSAGLSAADIAFGQPDPVACLASSRLKWVAINTAGYTRYDTPEFRETLRERAVLFTNMSSVYAEPCAQHLLGMMLALNRGLPESWADQQRSDPVWSREERRGRATLLDGETVLLLGYGAIARRLVELLRPFAMKVYALRRRTYSETGVHLIAEAQLSAVLPEVDHLVNILPQNASTDHFVNARRLALVKHGARFYNIGRGSTVDQQALIEALHDGRLAAAYLDATEPEPLPPGHALWRTPHCHITPHCAGGFRGLGYIAMDHFLANLRSFAAGDESAITDQVK